MSFLSKFVAPYRKGEKNFERGRDAESRRDFDAAKRYFLAAAEAFDAHFAKKNAAGDAVRPSHLAMAGICYTRLGRNEDALAAFDMCIGQKDIPDAFLHAGYAAAKLDRADMAVDYWSRYPAWAEQPFIAATLKSQIEHIRETPSPDLKAACEAVTEAVFRQDRENAKTKLSTPHNKPVPPKRGY